MLSSSPSLLSALSPVSIASGETVVSAAGEAASGFAELLNGLATKAVAAISGEEGEAQPGAEPVAPKSEAAPAKGKTTTLRLGRLALAVKMAAEARHAPVAAVAGQQPATAVLAAIDSGKILPVALPEAAEGQTRPVVDAKAETVANGATVAPEATAAIPSPLPIVAAILSPVAAQAETTDSAVPTPANSSRRLATAAVQALTHKVNPPLGQPADKTRTAAPAAETRPVPAVAITVAAPAPVTAPAAVETADSRPVAPVRPKAARAADLARIEAALPQASTPAATLGQLVQADQPTHATSAPTPAVSTPMPSPRDIDAALDHLVAAREALMPAEAAVAIHHAEFGEVSIKFEQSSDGRLSAELTAADPELQRAVTAATASDRGAATTPDGDRSGQPASHRGSATAGGDAATGGRGQSAAQSGTHSGRDLPQRHAPARSAARQGATDQGSGVFA